MLRVKRGAAAIGSIFAVASWAIVLQMFVACGPTGEVEPTFEQNVTALESTPQAPVATANAKDTGVAESEGLKTWTSAMALARPGRAGCFRATHPDNTWKEVPCGARPKNPHPSRRASALDAKLAAGSGSGGGDYEARTGDDMWAAGGWFPAINGVTSETDSDHGSGSFSLQLNSGKFLTPLCAYSPNRDCRGWQQFIYQAEHHWYGDYTQTNIQYWLVDFNNWIDFPWGTVNVCPDGWDSSGGHCWKNGTYDDVPFINSVTDLGAIKLYGFVGAQDSVELIVGNTLYLAQDDSVLGLSAPGQWRSAQFNVYGLGENSQAIFNSGSMMDVALAVWTPSKASPQCLPPSGPTGESNNLTFVNGSCCPVAAGTAGITGAMMTLRQTNGTGWTAPFCLLNDVVPIGLPLL